MKSHLNLGILSHLTSKSSILSFFLGFLIGSPTSKLLSSPSLTCIQLSRALPAGSIIAKMSLGQSGDLVSPPHFPSFSGHILAYPGAHSVLRSLHLQSHWPLVDQSSQSHTHLVFCRGESGTPAICWAWCKTVRITIRRVLILGLHL